MLYSQYIIRCHEDKISQGPSDTSPVKAHPAKMNENISEMGSKRARANAAKKDQMYYNCTLLNIMDKPVQSGR